MTSSSSLLLLIFSGLIITWDPSNHFPRFLNPVLRGVIEVNPDMPCTKQMRPIASVETRRLSRFYMAYTAFRFCSRIISQPRIGSAPRPDSLRCSDQSFLGMQGW
ncbi:hypothetical protein RHSIM_Rhsim05G0062400 [Rhododendron simsii]|uniref:Secreted protein n=1 Tax=Rhododendron simsii TaxID=118357 RepID=A0A834GZ82_RHOSS|nr:hypothetical protein RHSIM_Rhsim05G0062400 [Rhododendron simsii]